jgi:hypothetical protein
MLDILDVLLIAVFLDQQASFSKVVSRHPGEEVMRDLQMETSVNELDIFGADYVHGSTKLTRGERFEWTQIISGASEMRQNNLNLQLSSQMRKPRNPPERGQDWRRYG